MGYGALTSSLGVDPIVGASPPSVILARTAVALEDSPSRTA